MVMVQKGEECFIINKNLVDQNYHWKNWVDLMNNKQEESCNLFIKTLYFQEKVPNVKKYT